MEEGQAVAVADDKVGLVMGRRMTELQGQLPTPDSLGGRLQISVCGRQLGQPLNLMDRRSGNLIREPSTRLRRMQLPPPDYARTPSQITPNLRH